MIQDRKCRDCRVEFRGGPRAYYCSTCREKRRKNQETDYLQRKRKGEIREIGSEDICERCGWTYTVKGSLQRFCPECSEINRIEHDRITSLQTYHAKKDKINPIRNKRRMVRRWQETSNELKPREYRTALYASKIKFKKIRSNTGIKYVSKSSDGRFLVNLPGLKTKAYTRLEEAEDSVPPEYKRLLNCKYCKCLFNVAILGQKYCSDLCRSKAHKKKRNESVKLKSCPQCGKPWTEPLSSSTGKKPKHCLKCQEYYKSRYRRAKT